MVEQLLDVIEDLADQIGVYGAHEEDEKAECRCCWTSRITERIRRAVEIDRRLETPYAD